MTEAEQKIERERVEWVFGLTGGELEDEAWEGNRYWFDGPPEYGGEDFRDQYAPGVEYRTVVRNALYAPSRQEIQGEPTAKGPGPSWRLVRTFTSSGETECPGRGDTSGETLLVGGHLAPGLRKMETVGAYKVGAVTDGRCPLCEAEKGQPHGFIYLGEGWVEVVYRRQVEETP